MKVEAREEYLVKFRTSTRFLPQGRSMSRTGFDLMLEWNPITNPYYEKGQAIDVFALPAPKEWRTERGLSVLGPKAFGLDVDYRPICE